MADQVLKTGLIKEYKITKLDLPEHISDLDIDELLKNILEMHFYYGRDPYLTSFKYNDIDCDQTPWLDILIEKLTENKWSEKSYLTPSYLGLLGSTKKNPCLTLNLFISNDVDLSIQHHFEEWKKYNTDKKDEENLVFLYKCTKAMYEYKVPYDAYNIYVAMQKGLISKL